MAHFFGRWRGAVRIHVTCSSHVAINVHGNYYYMVEGSPQMWLMCMVINVQGNNYYMVAGSPHVWLTCMVINVQGNNYNMVEGSPHVCAHMWQLTCTVITRGVLTCGSRAR